MRLAVLIASLLLSAPAVFAYPIFYKCDAHRRMSDVLTGGEVERELAPLLALDSGRREAALQELCAGSEQCEKQLGQILDVTQVDQSVAEKIFEQQLRKLYQSAPNQPAQALDESSFDLREQIEKAGFQDSACRETIEDLPASAFANTGVFIYTPHYNEYTYATGCQNSPSGWICKQNSAKVLEDGIRRAVEAGVDPYFALAIGLMENGPNGVASLYLDPIGKFEVMGCKNKISSKGLLSSFGNQHEIDPGVVDNPALSRRLADALSADGVKSSSQTSYFCRKINNATGFIVDSPGKEECCLPIPAKPISQLDSDGDNVAVGAVEGQLLMEFLRDVQKQQLPGKSDPAYRLQGFNGFSHLMGGAEGVPVFRAGVDEYKTPTYGYQGMDFILNSLISNPYIRSLVDKITKETGGKYASVLCQDVAVPGLFQIDSDYYYDKHRDAPRLEELVDKSWDAMTGRQKKVLADELVYPKVNQQLRDHFDVLPGAISGASSGSPVSTLVKLADGGGYVVSASGAVSTFGGYKGPVPQGQAALVALGQPPIDPEKAAKGVSIQWDTGVTTSMIPSGGFSPEAVAQPLFKLQSGNQKFSISYDDGKLVEQFIPGQGFQIVKPPGMDSKSAWQHMDGANYEIQLPNGSSEKVTTSCDEAVAKIFVHAHPGIAEIAHCQISESGAAESLQEKVSYIGSPGSSFTLVTGALTPAALTRLEGKTSGTATVEKIPSVQQVVSYYFKNIYPDRNTVGKASSYAPWADLTEKQLRVIAGAFQGTYPSEPYKTYQLGTAYKSGFDSMGSGGYVGSFPGTATYPGPTPAEEEGGAQ